MATVTASVAGGNSNTNAAWVGGVQPTAADDVVIPASSAGITIPAAATLSCRSVDASGGTLVFAATTSTLAVGDASGGAVTFSATSTLTLTGIGTIRLASTSTNGGAGWTITTGGKTLPNLTTTGAGGKWVQGDALTCAVFSRNETNGTWVTNNFSVTAVDWTGTAAGRTVTLGSSTVTMTGGNGQGYRPFGGSGSQTVHTANTATIYLPNSGDLTAVSGPQDLGGASVVAAGSGQQTTNGGGITCLNYTRTGTAAKTDSIRLAGDLTCTGTFTVTSNSAVNRVFVFSGTVGTTRTITAAAVVLGNVVDFQDITGSGAATWTVAGTGATAIGNAGGLSGITATASVDRYAVAAGNTSSTAMWATASGGAAGASVPLPQDRVFFDANSGAGTYTQDMPRFGADLNFTGFTRTWSALTVAWSSYGSLTLSPTMTYSGGATVYTLQGRGTHTILTNGKTVAQTLAVNGPGGSYTLLSALTLSGGFGFSVNGGAFDSGSFNISAGTFTSGGSIARSMAFGTSALTFTATTGTPWNLTGSNMTVSAASATVTYSAASSNTRIFAGAGFSYGALTYTVAASTGTLSITGANTIGTVNVSGGARTLILPASTITTVTTWNVFGTAGNVVTVNSSISGTPATLAKGDGNPTVSAYLSIKDIAATPGSTWYAGATSTDVSGNSGWIFTDMPVGAQVATRWAVRATVGAQRATTWRTRAAAGRSVSTLWGTRATTGRSASLRWAVRTSAGTQRSTTWRTRAGAGRTVSTTWATRAAAGRSVDVRWSVLSAVGTQRAIRWATRQSAARNVAISWATRRTCGGSVGITWRGGGSVGVAIALRWNVRTSVHADRALRWNDRHATGRAVTTRWQTRRVVGQQVLTTWNVRDIQHGGAIRPTGHRAGRFVGSTGPRAGRITGRATVS